MKSNLDYWGTYNGWKVYKYFGKDARVESRKQPDIVLASGGSLWCRGYVIGHVTGMGSETDWDMPEWKNFKEPEEEEEDGLLTKVMRRTIEELVGERLADYSKKDPSV